MAKISLVRDLEFKQQHVEEILRLGWHTWERESRRSVEEPVEVLAGGTAGSFLSYIHFERAAAGEDQGHRQLLAERALQHQPTLHALSQELALTEREVLDLIQGADRLKMAVRGWAAEEHLFRHLQRLPGIASCTRLGSNGPDLAIRLTEDRALTVECKNVLRVRDREGRPRLDFQRTRASKSDPCSRYYSPHDFDVVAACLHAVTERWEFRFAQPGGLDPHGKCPGKLSSNVRLDSRWSADPLVVFRAAAGLA